MLPKEQHFCASVVYTQIPNLRNGKVIVYSLLKEKKKSVIRDVSVITVIYYTNR